jgi:2-methylcitrate dehydratase PrpD
MAEWVSTCRADRIPVEVKERALSHIIDTFAAMVAGSALDVPRLIAARLRRRGRTGASIICGMDFALDCEDSALVNGISAHILDIDDQSYSLMGHPSAVVLPAVLAAAEEAEASGNELLTGFIVGVEVACKLGAALNPIHFQNGWHSTATVGAFGAAAACATIWGVSADVIASSFGLVPIMAGGLRANNGTEAKAYQVGQAAHGGIVASNLARAGLLASPDILEASDGFVQASNFGLIGIEPILRLGDPFDLVSPGIMIKRYPACSAAGAVIDAAKELAGGGGFQIEAIERIECNVTPLAYRSLPHRIPATALQAKFSAPFCIAAAIIDGDVPPEVFSLENVHRADIRRLAEKVEISCDQSGDFAPPSGPEGATVTVFLNDGQSFQVTVAQPLGGPARPMSTTMLQAKFRAYTEPVLGQRYIALLEKLTLLRNVQSLAELTRLLR